MNATSLSPEHEANPWTNGQPQEIGWYWWRPRSGPDYTTAIRVYSGCGTGLRYIETGNSLSYGVGVLGEGEYMRMPTPEEWQKAVASLRALGVEG